MRQRLTLCSLIFILFHTFCATAHASWVTLTTETDSPGVGERSSPDGHMIVLTFGDEYVVIHDALQPIPGGRLIAEDVPLSELFLVRDRRALGERTGYYPIYSHHGFHLAIVKAPGRLEGLNHVLLRPIAGSMVVTEKPKTTQLVPNRTVEKVLDMLDPGEYRQYMSMLAEDIPTRFCCSKKQNIARDIIRDHFRALGLSTQVISYNNSCNGYSCNQRTGFDVIGIKKGSVRPDEYYLVGAHYDSTSGQPCVSAPGANDNASGTAAVMELARLFSGVDTEASLIFAAFSGEEEGFWGSKKYVQTLIESGLDKKLKAFVIMDMISFYKSNFGVLVEGSGASLKQRAAIKRLADLGLAYTDLSVETSTNYYGSDHAPFLNKGMAGALLIELDEHEYPYYHGVKDKMVHQNIPYAMEFLRLAGAALAEGGIAAINAH